ncbi:hypothetical protein LCGC14_0414220 [marine sediment metagenome]|uniref:Uncharacterized protein n=1 Tax=marine sediment metagenome TaxID=412755 RepID=A0A0F9VEX8_9ZZZZ
MCEPITIMAAAGLAMSAAGSGVAAYGQIRAGQAAKAQAEFQADVARNNAITFRAAADDTYDRGEEFETQFRLQAEDLKGQQRAAFASNGILLGEGTALTVLEDTAQLTELDALTIRNNVERQAVGLLSQGNSFLAQSALFSNVAASASGAARLGAFSTLLGGEANTAFQTVAFKQSGVF